jgi:hypothetical protein
MYAADAVAEAARDTAGQTGVASDGPILAALAAIRRQNIASLSGRTPAQRKRQSLARKRLKPASQKRAGRSETGDIRCDADRVARDRFCGRPAVQPGRHETRRTGGRLFDRAGVRLPKLISIVERFQSFACRPELEILRQHLGMHPRRSFQPSKCSPLRLIFERA